MSVLRRNSLNSLRCSSAVFIVCTLLATLCPPTYSICITETPSGTYIGLSKLSALYHYPMCSYLGIRYAQVPTGDKRFGEPVPVDNALLPTPALADGSLCPQTLKGIPLSLNEDCLILNVYRLDNLLSVPDPKAPLKSVICYIHGGGLLIGGSFTPLYSADFLVEKDVIVVTMNYRLGVLGFLDLGVPDCGGNMGLKDMLLVLKWIKKNIQAFGGDPNSVTLMGESGGAWAAYLLAMSPKTRGLFNKVALQSPISPKNFAKNFTRSRSYKFGGHMGYTGDMSDGQAICNFLKQKTLPELIIGAETFANKLAAKIPVYNLFFVTFWPVIDKDMGDRALLPDELSVLGPKVPNYKMIMGQCGKEGAVYFLRFFGPDFSNSTLGATVPLLGTALSAIAEPAVFLSQVALSADNEYIVQRLKDNLEAYLRAALLKEGQSIVPGGVAKVHDYYFNQLGENDVSAATDLLGDLAFYDIYDKMALFNASFSSGNIYTYEIDFDGQASLTSKILLYGIKDAPTVKGMPHLADIFYTFYSYIINPVYLPNDDEKRVTELYSNIFVNLAKNGNPNGDNLRISQKWNPISSSSRDYLLVSATPHIETGGIHGERRQLLESITTNTSSS